LFWVGNINLATVWQNSLHPRKSLPAPTIENHCLYGLVLG